MTSMRFRMALIGDAPVFDISPISSRMVSAYQDRTGCTHLFTDWIDHDRQTAFDMVIDSFDTKIAYYSSPDLKQFDDHGIVVDRDSEPGARDNIGAASPAVAVAGDKVLLYYAGRGPCDPAGPFHRATGLPQLPGQIGLAIAPADENGAPCGPFVKHGPITDYGAPWRTMRHDDPCAVIVEDQIYLFYKGISRRGDRNARVIGLARGRVDDPAGPYELLPDPVLVTEPDGETPRVFKVGDAWHMFFLRTKSTAQRAGRVYEHYVTNDPTQWMLVDDKVYESASPVPGAGAPDMCPIWTPFVDGPPGAPELAFGVRMDESDGRLKQWLFSIETTKA